MFLVRILVGALFALSGFTKLLQPYGQFLAVVDEYKVVTGTAAQAVAAFLPWAEFIPGVFLLVGLWFRQSLALLWVLNTAFLGVVASAILRKLPLEECGCFGEAFSLTLPQMLALDSFLWLAFLLLTVFYRQSSAFGLDRLFNSRPS